MSPYVAWLGNLKNRTAAAMRKTPLTMRRADRRNPNLETIRQLETMLTMRHYKGFLK